MVSPVVPVTENVGEVTPITLVSPLSPVTHVRVGLSPRVLSAKQSESGEESNGRRASGQALISPELIGSERGVVGADGREKRRSTLKEKRQLHPMVSHDSADHARTPSIPAMFPVI